MKVTRGKTRHQQESMSLRDQFASAALTGISAHFTGAKTKDNETPIQAHARWAYTAADAMMEARKNK